LQFLNLKLKIADFQVLQVKSWGERI